MLGERTLFYEPPVTTQEVPLASKGRSAVLDAARNELICHRYYYYHSFFDKRYDSIISTLSEEFFLAGITIVEILKRNISTLQKLRTEKTAKSAIAKRYPHFNW